MTLIERLEAASGHSKALDAEIARNTGWHRVEPRFSSSKDGGWIEPKDFLGVEVDGRPKLDQMHGTTIHRFPPRYTASIDAAASLYDVLPDTIPSDPRKACIAALRAKGVE